MFTIGEMMTEFAKWLEDELKSRRWTRADLSRATGLSQTAFSQIFKGQRKPGPDLCIAVARALEVPEEDVFRKAGLLPEKPEDDDKFAEETIERFKRLTVEQRRAVLEYVIYQLREEDRRLREAQENEGSGND